MLHRTGYTRQMISSWSIAWDVLWTAIVIVLALRLVHWLVEWRRGRRTMLDEQRRLKPAVALSFILAALVAVGSIAAMIAE